MAPQGILTLPCSKGLCDGSVFLVITVVTLGWTVELLSVGNGQNRERKISSLRDEDERTIY